MQKISFCCLQGQGHNEGSCIKICFYYILRAADPFATKFSLMVHHRESECPVKHRVAVFTVSITVMVQNFIKCFPVLFSVPLISLQANYVCCCTSINN